MYIVPPSLGSRVSKATAENVVKPEQKPGNQKCLWFMVPRRSIKTIKKVAMATPNKFAMSVAVRELVNNSPIVKRSSEPSIPPSETNEIDRTLTLWLMY
jgi:hypothetical protein